MLSVHTNSPKTTNGPKVANLGKIISDDGDTLLCEIKPGLNLRLRASGEHAATLRALSKGDAFSFSAQRPSQLHGILTFRAQSVTSLALPKKEARHG
jgi:hypothetical protein